MPKKSQSPPAGFVLDSFDRAILRIIQRNNKLPQRRIAEQVHLSAAAVQRRIAAMEVAGVIDANVAIVNRDAVSASITAVVEVMLVDETAASIDAAKALFCAAPEVQQCFYVTGDVSFVLIIVAANMPRYEQLFRRLFAENQLVKRFQTMIALDRAKTDSAIVIPC